MANQRQPTVNTNKLNPFYIEDAREDEWNGDWRNDEDDWEEEGLLGDHDDRNMWTSRGSPPRRGHRHQHMPQPSCSPCRFRMCVTISVVFSFFFILLSLTSSDNRMDQTDGNDTFSKDSSDGSVDSVVSTVQPQSAPIIKAATESPTIQPTLSPSTKPTETPVAAPSPGTVQPTMPGESLAPTFKPVSEAPTASPSNKPMSTSASDTRQPAAENPVEPAADEPADDSLKPPPPKQIAILGERQTGVDWWKQHLHACFPGIAVHSKWVRGSVWFQTVTPSSPLPKDDDRVLIVYAVRNVYDWLPLMRKRADFAPSHLSLSWDEFLTKPWTWNSTDDVEVVASNETCQAGFTSAQVVPCHELSKDRSNPLYEMDADGEPFSDILKLRAAKIAHILDLPNQFETALHPDVLLASYHAHGDTLSGNDTPMIMKIASLFNVSTSTDCNVQALPPPADERSEIPAETLTMIQNEADWNIEAKLGYSLTDIPH